MKGWRPSSVAEIAEDVAAGTRVFDPAVREFLDQWQSMNDDERIAALSGEPVKVGRVHDAYVAAVAEHLARGAGIDIPEWTESADRFLTEPFFAGGLESLKAMLIVESPVAFRRRLIFISANALDRPRRAGYLEPEGVPS